MKPHTESPRSHARLNFSVFAMRARAFVASRASSRAFARPLARASSSRARRPARALEKSKRVGARTRAFEDQDCDDFLSTSSVTTTETPDAWTESSFTRLDDGCVAFGVSISSRARTTPPSTFTSETEFGRRGDGDDE